MKVSDKDFKIKTLGQYPAWGERNKTISTKPLRLIVRAIFFIHPINIFAVVSYFIIVHFYFCPSVFYTWCKRGWNRRGVMFNATCTIPDGGGFALYIKGKANSSH